MRRITIAIAGLATLTWPALAQSVDDLITIERDVNAMCRGWSGDDQHIQQICIVRDKLDKVLNNAGYCYGRRGQIGTDMRWHRCGPTSMR